MTTNKLKHDALIKKIMEEVSAAQEFLNHCLGSVANRSIGYNICGI